MFYKLGALYNYKNVCNNKNPYNCQFFKYLGDEIVLMVINKLQRGPVNDVKLLRLQFVSSLYLIFTQFPNICFICENIFLFPFFLVSQLVECLRVT